MVWACLCAGVCVQLLSFYLALQARIRRSAATARRRLHHRLRAIRRDRWRSARVRFLLQAGNVARAIVDLARVGRRHVESWRDAWDIVVHGLLRTSSQNLMAESRLPFGRKGHSWINLRTD